MAYVDGATPKSRATAIAGVAAIHAGLGAILIYGLATGGITKMIEDPFEGTLINLDPPPPPIEPTPEPRTDPVPSSREVVAPAPPIPMPPSGPNIDTTDEILPPSPPAPRPIPSTRPTAAPLPPPPVPTPSFDPVVARPSNNPGSWVTQNDYRSSWVAREYTGEVGFRLSIGASGRVEGCSVTRSSGVSALDEATCQLVTRRARFDPAKNGQGRAVAGSYASAVRWQLPD